MLSKEQINHYCLNISHHLPTSNLKDWLTELNEQAQAANNSEPNSFNKGYDAGYALAMKKFQNEYQRGYSAGLVAGQKNLYDYLEKQALYEVKPLYFCASCAKELYILHEPLNPSAKEDCRKEE